MKRLVVLSLFAVFVGGCTKVGTTDTPAGGAKNSFTIPHVLRYATAEDVNTLNPHLGQQATLGLMSSLTMAVLTKWDRQNKPVPELATEVPLKSNGGISADGLTITYHLRHGVKWSDGAPFNADDVVFSTKVVLNPANNEVSRTGWDKIVKVDEPDKYTVVYHLSKPYAPFIVTFFSTAGGNPCILPKHLLEKLPNINNAAYNSLPVGIGPFKYKAWKRGESVTMVPDPNYFRGLPKLQQVVFKIVPDRNTLMTEMQGQQLDLWYPVPGSYFARVNSLAGYTYIRQPAYQYNHLDFNMKSPRLSDPAVRQALRYALDRAEILHKIAHDVGVLQEIPASKVSPYYDPNVPLIPFNIAKANQILDRAGWVRGADGIRQKNGVKLLLDFAAVSGLQDVDQQLELIRSNWKKIGADLNIHHYQSALYFSPMQSGGILYGGKWDATSFAWVNDPIGDYSFTYACDEFPPNGQNDMRWCNPKVDAATHALFGHYDQSQRNADDAVVQEELVKDAATVVMNGREDIFVFNSDLKNFHPNAVTPFDDFMNVDI